MTFQRRLLTLVAATAAALALTAAPSMAIVGGSDAAQGEYPSVAEVTIAQAFLCTGTLIAPNYVLTAGHCGSITGGTRRRLPGRLARGGDRRPHRLQQARPGREGPGLAASPSSPTTWPTRATTSRS